MPARVMKATPDPVNTFMAGVAYQSATEEFDLAVARLDLRNADSRLAVVSATNALILTIANGELPPGGRLWLTRIAIHDAEQALNLEPPLPRES